MIGASRLQAHVAALCGVGKDRHPGTERNRAATAYVAMVMRELGIAVDELEFAVPDWRYGTAEVRIGTDRVPAHPGPFSPGFEGEGTLVSVQNATELAEVDATGAVLLLHGEIAGIQLTARDYPWYSDPGHAELLDLLEATGAKVVLAATGKNPAMTAGMSPFPLIEEPRFALPTAYVTAEQGVELLSHVGRTVAVTVESETVPSTGSQLVGRIEGSGVGRIVVAAHIDTKPDTPGALDNAAGVAVLLAAAELLADRRLRHTVEFVPFNGEDHVLSPGEIAYLSAHPDLSDVALMVNIDGAGLAGSAVACSSYGLGADLAATLADRLSVAGSAVVDGPQWPASDHMIFAMRGVPAVALTSLDADTATDISHTPADTPAVVDSDALAEAADFVAALVESV
jgi:aminopeptidase YwaD